MRLLGQRRAAGEVRATGRVGSEQAENGEEDGVVGWVGDVARVVHLVQFDDQIEGCGIRGMGGDGDVCWYDVWVVHEGYARWLG